MLGVNKYKSRLPVVLLCSLEACVACRLVLKTQLKLEPVVCGLDWKLMYGSGHVALAGLQTAGVVAIVVDISSQVFMGIPTVSPAWLCVKLGNARAVCYAKEWATAGELALWPHMLANSARTDMRSMRVGSSRKVGPAGGNVLHRREARLCEQFPECVDIRTLAWNALREKHSTGVWVVLPGHTVVWHGTAHRDISYY
eukprot:1161895-Pelagomonas_calceolata.AAC.8